MRKIGQFIEETKRLLNKEAFIPASAVMGGQQGGGQPGQPQQGGGSMEKVQQLLQQLPPEVQQQAQQALQQVQGLPPEQQEQALQQVAQGLEQMVQQGGAPQQGGQPQPGGQPQDPPQPQPESTQGHVQAENQLDNTKVTLSVRELMDLTSGGQASASLLKVKQLADAHNQKMQQNQQKIQQQQAQQEAEAQATAQAQQGGLYATAPDTSGKMGPTQ